MLFIHVLDGRVGSQCCKLDNSGPLKPEHMNPNCIPVNIPKNDAFYSKVNVSCQNYIRLARTVDNNCKISYVQVTILMIIFITFVKLIEKR